ncbi:MAG: NAD(P)-dependent alcohol dehydrogenase [Pseudomonadota bacterium]
MKAIQLKQPGGLENIFVGQLDEPAAPASGEIKVKIHAGSLNYHDYLVAIGALPSDDGRVLLSDGAGVVLEVGDNVTEFKPGDNVVSTFFPQWQSGLPKQDAGDFAMTPGDGVDGFACEIVTRSVNAFTLSPKDWTHEESATITTAGLTAWRALVDDGKVKAGDTIVTLGTGGVSIAALQIGKMLGANVIVTSSSDEKLERAKALGADHLINYKSHPNWSEQVMELTDGKGADHIIELGGPGTLEQSANAIKVGGQISLIGVLTGFEGALPTAQLLFKQVRLQGLLVGNRDQQQAYIKAIESNNIHAIVDKTFNYEALADAFDYQIKGSHFGKIATVW